MAEALGHHGERHAGGQHQRGLTVPKIVQPHRPHARSFGELPEPLRDRLRVQRLPVLSREHQAVVGVRRPPRRALRVLGEPVAEQGSHGAVVQVDQPGVTAGRLRRPEPQLMADHHNLLPDHQPAALQVHIGPAQTARLPAAQTAGSHHLEQHAEPIAGGVVEEAAQLVGLSRPDLRPGRLRQRDVHGRVVRHQAPALRIRQGGPEGGVDSPDRGRSGVDLGQHGLYVPRAQVPEPDPAELRDEVVPEVLPVGPFRGRPQPVGHLALDPAGEELPHRLPLVVRVLTGAQVVQQLGERVLCCLPCREPALRCCRRFPSGPRPVSATYSHEPWLTRHAFRAPRASRSTGHGHRL